MKANTSDYFLTIANAITLRLLFEDFFKAIKVPVFRKDVSKNNSLYRLIFPLTVIGALHFTQGGMPTIIEVLHFTQGRCPIITQ